MAEFEVPWEYYRPTDYNVRAVKYDGSREMAIAIGLSWNNGEARMWGHLVKPGYYLYDEGHGLFAMDAELFHINFEGKES